MSMEQSEQEQHQDGISIYRFESDNCRRLIQLLENKLYISNPNSFNDSFDLRLIMRDTSDRAFERDNFQQVINFIYKNKLINKYYILDKDIEEYIDCTFSQTFLNPSDLNNLACMIKNHILTFGVQCFSSNYNIASQWERYSNFHKGFCIEYNFRKMDFAYGNNGFASYDVSYTSKLPEVCITEVLLTPHQVIEKLLATKTLDWACEQEIRIINFEKQGQLVDMPIGLSIKSLIAGVNMSDKHLTLLKQTGEKLAVPVYQMKRGKNDFDPLWSREEL